MVLKYLFPNYSSSSDNNSDNGTEIPARELQLTSSKLASPLHIPELLGIIFTFINQYALKNSVQYVSKQWHSIARPLIRNRLVWTFDLKPPYDQAFLLDQLYQVHELSLCIPEKHEDGVNLTLQNIDILKERIVHLAKSNKLRIVKLVYYTPHDLKLTVYPLIRDICTLTDLDLVDIQSERIHIFVILALCPRLRSLKIDCRNIGGIHSTLSDTIPPEYDLHGFETSGIKSLTLVEFFVRQTILESTLKKCPELRTLRINDILRKWDYQPFDRSGFYQSVANSCPLLQLIHFSEMGEHTRMDSPLAMMRAFLPGQPFFLKNQSLLGIGKDDKLQLIHDQYRKSNLNTISVLERDISLITAKIFFSPFLDAHYKDTVTTLEISTKWNRPHNSIITEALHNFFCSATSLEHILSPSVPYFAEYLDLSGATLDGSYSPKSCKDRDQVSDIVMSKKIWACRRLRTLQLRFISKTHDVASIANSRIMFAYIAKVCPRLEVLSIDRVALDLKLESGFCWLTELRFLQRLSILTWTRTELKKQDFEWMAPQPLVRYSFGDVGSSTTWLRRSLTSYSRRLNRPGRSEINSGKPEGENLNDLIILKDLENLDLISNLKPYPTDSQLSVEECWPQLEFLGICLTLTNNNEILHSEDHLPDLIAGIRPGVEFSCNYSHW